MRWFALWLGLMSAQSIAQEANETRELIGQLGGRATLLNLYTSVQPDGAARVTGDYLVLPTQQQRFLEGERSKQLGVTVLREGATPILYGRPQTGTLQGTWSGGVFRGVRYGPEGQERERFEFSESFPSMDAYNASVRCEVSEGRYASTFALAVENGKLKSVDWRSKVSPGEHPCTVAGLEQRPQNGGLRFAAGRCSVTLRNLGEYVRVTAEDCAAMCGSQGYLEPVLIDRRGNCQLLRPRTR
jgi:hypothetical protein